DSVPVLVKASGHITTPQLYAIAPGQPGIFVAGTLAAVLDGQSRLITPDNPARIGDTLQIYSNGLGITNPPVDTGAAAPSFTTVNSPVKVTIGGVDVPVVYQGLAPGFVGLYQVNVVLLTNVPVGSSVPVVVTQNGIASNPNVPVNIPIR